MARGRDGMNALGTTAPATDAFSRQSGVFDAIDAANPLIGRMRALVRAEALKHMKPRDALLELNAGTGIDSFYFAEQGLRVLATDGAEGMVAELQAKQRTHPQLHVDVMACSFLELERLGDRRFDHVFSNFGGLNCTPHLDQALHGIDRVLRPGGTCALVIMPRFSPWELLAVLKGRVGLALRRWRRGGTVAHLEGLTFLCHYFSPRYVRKHLGQGYEVITQRALSLVVPPPHMERFPSRWPRLLRALDRIEEGIAHRWPFRNWGDHYLIILRKAA
ncbi:MAG TPA: class I SAM-dependent methyltransferase [Flavobacteriales bacterium]|jgi:ubiquinone/menaquinone biosynthesis C-methylase UbiE|nr:class I SAM-dependent methyltransferase [Flavobacteriales bacterium]